MTTKILTEREMDENVRAIYAILQDIVAEIIIETEFRIETFLSGKNVYTFKVHVSKKEAGKLIGKQKTKQQVLVELMKMFSGSHDNRYLLFIEVHE